MQKLGRGAKIRIEEGIDLKCRLDQSLLFGPSSSLGYFAISARP